ncbi:MarR family transcriptional regulator [Jiangella asiatica]|uniref:MarR family transcriptional regulator n=1 Tax=Jiangella asiatica TaxID=2530372 RepID=A0A4R5DLE8_9ACTN|nr:MarR family transcriptional regulator [Jiangella asiatica]TDE11463.1 MarR family transcriptional regulator [Jiangella asiatica]
MAAVIGVVGPPDIVDAVAPHCDQYDGVTAMSLDYADEAEAPAIVEAQTENVAGWLFTGIGPYTRADRAGVLDRPAVYLPYTREALQLALIGLLRSGQPIDRLSVDTMSHNAVERCLGRAGVATDHVRVLPYRPELGPNDYAEFHRRARTGESGTTHAITCVPAVHEQLRRELPAIRLHPTRHAIRSTLRHLVLSMEEAALGHAQIVLGLIETSAGTSAVLRHITELSGCPGQRADGTFIVVTTRGRLAGATGDFTGLPLLERLAGVSSRVHIGFGLGRTAAEAEHHARRAVIRSRRVAPVAAVFSRRNDADLILAEITPAADPRPHTIDRLSQQSGISAATLTTIRDLDLRDSPLTAGELARRLGLQTRSARRILAKLEGAGLAERTGEAAGGARGRPATFYRILAP